MDDGVTVLSDSIDVGERVFDSEGRLLGHVSGFDDDGFEVDSPVSPGDDVEEVPGQEFGEGYLMWRCGECGEMAELEDGLPETCPACGVGQELLLVVQED